MSKNRAISRSTAAGRFVPSALGKPKATKFSAVEGLKLNDKSALTINSLESKGLKGDALRSAITGSFTKKRG